MFLKVNDKKNWFIFNWMHVRLWETTTLMRVNVVCPYIVFVTYTLPVYAWHINWLNFYCVVCYIILCLSHMTVVVLKFIIIFFLNSFRRSIPPLTYTCVRALAHNCVVVCPLKGLQYESRTFDRERSDRGAIIILLLLCCLMIIIYHYKGKSTRILWTEGTRGEWTETKRRRRRW